jgi:glyoxylase-like metal-dependent hydrolase (beta-lactamase superfamily II)
MQDVSPAEGTDLALEPILPHHVAPEVWRIPVPVPFAVHSLNVYLMRGDGHGGGVDNGWCLVDAPLGTAQAEQALLAGLDAAGATPRDITAIVLTHGHPDHLGAVGRWQRRSGAPVYLLGLEAQLISALWADPTHTAFLEAAHALARHGMPGDEAQRLVTQAAQMRGSLEPPEPATALAHGQRVTLAGGHFRVFWTPGHADGHLCLLRDDGLFVAGDHVLPRVTPTVGRYPWSRPDPLADHDASLASVADLPARLVLPGHGQPFTDLRGRANELRGVHARQTAAVARLLANAPAGTTAYALAQQFFAPRWRAPESRLWAVAETVAHLEHLRYLGRAERLTAADGAVTYRRTTESLGPGVRADEPPEQASA